MIAGSAPEVIGQFDIKCDELMFYQYLPVCMPKTLLHLPESLECFRDLFRPIEWNNSSDYVYLTAKNMFVGLGCDANRPGWHLDGFGTDDINYIWSDSIPTEFCIQPFDLSEDHEISMLQMEEQAKPENIVTYPETSLLRLDSTVVHRVGKCVAPGYRTFVKISVSKERYNLKGNAHNYMFDYCWKMYEREETRNHPFVLEH